MTAGVLPVLSPLTIEALSHRLATVAYVMGILQSGVSDLTHMGHTRRTSPGLPPVVCFELFAHRAGDRRRADVARILGLDGIGIRHRSGRGRRGNAGHSVGGRFRAPGRVGTPHRLAAKLQCRRSGGGPADGRNVLQRPLDSWLMGGGVISAPAMLVGGGDGLPAIASGSAAKRRPPRRPHPGCPTRTAEAFEPSAQ